MSQFRFVVPLTKSEVDPVSGRIKVKGIATDHKKDLDGEIVKASDAPLSLKYLEEAGVLNWDHSHDIVGRVTKARLIPEAQARELYGRPIVGTAVEIEGEIHPIADESHALVAPRGLKNVHHLVKAGHPLYFSIQGQVERRFNGENEAGDQGIVVLPALIPQVAVTAQPRNTNAVCTIVKSFAQLTATPEELAAQVETQPAASAEEPVVTLFTKALDLDVEPETDPLARLENAAEMFKGAVEALRKSMEVTGVVPQPGTTGGDSLKSDGLGGGTLAGLGGDKPRNLDPTALMQRDSGDGNGGVTHTTATTAPDAGLRESLEDLARCMRGQHLANELRKLKPGPAPVPAAVPEKTTRAKSKASKTTKKSG